MIHTTNDWLKTKKLKEISKKLDEKIDALKIIRKTHEKKLRIISVFFVVMAILASYSLHLMLNPQDIGTGQWLPTLAVLSLMAAIPVTILFVLQWITTRRIKSAVQAKIIELIAEAEAAMKTV